MLAQLNAVSTNRILERILHLLPEHTYLVGGCIRDLLLGIEPFDFDLVTFGSAMDLARRIEEKLGAKAFLIDRERGVARIAVNHGEYTLDISPARGADIEADLRERDITINAMACLPAAGELIDPLLGCSDLQAKRIRLISEKNLLDDPLRGMRCLRFAVQLGYSVDELTMRLIRSHARTIAGTAPERIKHEFIKALPRPGGPEFFSLLDEAGYVREIFGDTLADKTKSLLSGAIRYADLVLEAAGQYLPGVGLHFSEKLEHGLTRSIAFRIAAFLFPGEGRQPSDERGSFSVPLSRLALSEKSCRTIKGAIAGAFRVLALSRGSRPTGSDMYKVLSSHDGYIPEMLLLALASDMAEHQGGSDSLGKVCRELWVFSIGQYQVQKNKPLLSGHDIIGSLGIPPGEIIGKLLRQVEEARADGRVTSRQEALSFIRNQSIR